VVALAALLGAARVPGVPVLRDQTFLFFGAGQANLGCARLLLDWLQGKPSSSSTSSSMFASPAWGGGGEAGGGGLGYEEARSRIWLYDSKGLVSDSRTDLSPDKKLFSHPDPSSGANNSSRGGYTLEETVREVAPTTLIGAASVGGAFDRGVLQALTKGGRKGGRPVVLALSNPTNKAECTYQQAQDWTEVRGDEGMRGKHGSRWSGWYG
jgi:malate dehydrogenase (oxaloacetate-decarboxylating)(NADP+)